MEIHEFIDVLLPKHAVVVGETSIWLQPAAASKNVRPDPIQIETFPLKRPIVRTEDRTILSLFASDPDLAHGWVVRLASTLTCIPPKGENPLWRIRFHLFLPEQVFAPISVLSSRSLSAAARQNRQPSYYYISVWQEGTTIRWDRYRSLRHPHIISEQSFDARVIFCFDGESLSIPVATIVRGNDTMILSFWIRNILRLAEVYREARHEQ